MNDASTLPLLSLQRIDKLCQAFEDAWQAGQSPRAEQYCDEIPEAERSSVLRRLLPLELIYRQQSGQSPIREEYLERFPHCEALIDEVFRQRSTTAAGPAAGAKIRYFGDYELLEEIARGGMGVVYKARQLSLNRIVALKLILGGQFASDEEVRRFHAEATAAAHLDHPGIVAIHEVGEQEGHHFFSMGLVEGESLAARAARGPLPPREAAEIIRAVAEAIQYAHERGVIHRDLKPANILLDAAGHPRITDFGLARRVTGDSSLTASGQVVGTPSFMPPEQAAGKRHEIGPVSDVYALGAVLYTLLTGRPPFQAASPLETLHQVLEHEPIAPRRLSAHVPKDLETICFRAMEKDPAKRYRSAADLAADLDRYLSGFAILARRVGPVGRIVRWAKRSRAVAASLLCVVALALAAAFFAYRLHAARESLITEKLDQSLIAAKKGDFDQAGTLVDEAEKLGAEWDRVETHRRQVALDRDAFISDKLDQALIKARIGEFVQAGTLIDEAEKLGAERDRVEAHRRQVAFHRNEFIREKLEQALIAAMIGDFEQADKRIDDAKEKGADPGKVEMLRGLVYLHSNNAEKAEDRLKRAVDLSPGSAAAHAMLAVAYYQNAKWEECVKALDVLEGLSPLTPEDYLFKGYAEATLDPSRGLGSIDEAIRLRPHWTIAHALRAEVRCWYAQDKADAAVVEQAREDARMVKKLLPNKPIGPRVSLYANLVAATIYGNQADERRKALAEAETDFVSLGDLPVSGWWAFMRDRYLEYLGRDDEALQEMARARDKVDSAWPATLSALLLYRLGDYEEARRVLDSLDESDQGAFQQTTRMFILAELPEGSKLAMDAYQKGEGRYQGTALLFWHTLLYLLGDKETAKTKYQAMNLPQALATVRQGSYERILAYNRGNIDEGELLKAVKNSKYHECNAHFFIAMKLLADDESLLANDARVRARQHFEACVATGCFDFDAYDWSRMFLARMNQDSAWPRRKKP